MMDSWAKHTQARIKGKPGYPMVEIIWDDAQAFATTNWEEEASSETAPTTTVGYLVKKNRRTYTVVSLINLNHVGHGIVIPRNFVREVRYLVVKAI